MAQDSLILAVVVGTVALLAVSALTMALTGRLRLPYPVALVLVGVGVALLAPWMPPELAALLSQDIPPEVVFYVFLPTLVFEAALNIDARGLRDNLVPVLALSIPGLLIAALVVATILVAFTPLGWPAAILVGTMLSATDPAAMPLFREVGAPSRLGLLVEGESLFNDATAIVVSKILIGVILGGVLTLGTIGEGVLEFGLVFVGGMAVGWAMAVATGWILGRVEADPFVEVTLTTILAYASYLVAEVALDLSGVMATLAAGLVLSGWGRTKVSPEVSEYLHQFWDYIAILANALIFLSVGLRIDLGALQAAGGSIALVIAAMLVGRGLAIFGLMPVAAHSAGREPVDRRYQTVVWWGGIRGGTSLAIALALPAALPGREDYIVLVMGAVLFSILVPGLTMKGLIQRLGLDRPSAADRLSRAEGLLAAKRHTLDQVPALMADGLFSPSIAGRIQERCQTGIDYALAEIETIREQELSLDADRRILFLRSLGKEAILYYEMFTRGHLSEGAYRDLAHSLNLQVEGIRYEGQLPAYTLHPPSGDRLSVALLRPLDRLPALRGITQRAREQRTVREHETSWGRLRGSQAVLASLDQLADEERIPDRVVDEARQYYAYWNEGARRRLDATAEQFPEFVTAMQERLAERLALQAEREVIESKAREGAISAGVADRLLSEMAQELRSLRSTQASSLRVSPEELLQKVPFFQGLPGEAFGGVTRRLRPRTVPAGEIIVRQGDSGDSLFLIARGVVRVARTLPGERDEKDVATLMAGDFFGEMALVTGAARSASCRAVTPCALYELQRTEIEALQASSPSIRAALQEAARRRRDELSALARNS
jgi:CPA1 family monovalent cation:H+ antiporter